MKLGTMFIVGASLIAPSTAPSTAFAQIFAPAGNVSTSLDPGSSPQPPAPAPAPQQTAAPPPQVYVVGPDGKVTSPDAEPADEGYYIGAGQAPMNVDADVELHSGPIPELHVVRTGDTLWDISYRYFANPWEWPKIWSYNAQITNPHWIYPADLVRLLPRGMFTSAVSEPEQQTPNQNQSQNPLPAPARRVDVSVKQIAFVEKKDLEKSIVIVGSPDEKVLLGDGDSVYLSYPENRAPEVGKRYSIYEPGQSVKSGGTEYGSYVRMLGEVQIVSVKQDKTARGLITRTNREIQRGAKVGPLLKEFKNVTPVAPTVDAQAPIVGMLTREQLIGDGEVVFVALGKASGAQVGNRMYVVRRGDGYPDEMANDIGKDDRRFPARALGEVVLVEVGEKVSVGLVTLSVQEMGVGDLVMMQKSK